MMMVLMLVMLAMLLLEGLPCSVAFNNGAANGRLPPLEMELVGGAWKRKRASSL